MIFEKLVAIEQYTGCANSPTNLPFYRTIWLKFIKRGDCSKKAKAIHLSLCSRRIRTVLHSNPISDHDDNDDHDHYGQQRTGFVDQTTLPGSILIITPIITDISMFKCRKQDSTSRSQEHLDQQHWGLLRKRISRSLCCWMLACSKWTHLYPT